MCTTVYSYSTLTSSVIKAVRPWQMTHTHPTTLNAFCTFLVGNLFGFSFTFCCGIILVYFILPAVGRIALVTLVAAYVARVVMSSAHVTGSETWRAFRTSWAWRHVLRYFDLKLVGSREMLAGRGLVDGQQYLVGCHPHGIHGFGIGVFTCVMTAAKILCCAMPVCILPATRLSFRCAAPYLLQVRGRRQPLLQTVSAAQGHFCWCCGQRALRDSYRSRGALRNATLSSACVDGTTARHNITMHF